MVINLNANELYQGNTGCQDILHQLGYPKNIWLEDRSTNENGSTHDQSHINYMFVPNYLYFINNKLQLTIDTISIRFSDHKALVPSIDIGKIKIIIANVG